MGFLAEAGTKVSHHGGVKKGILPKLRQAEKELKVGVFANMFSKSVHPIRYENTRILS